MQNVSPVKPLPYRRILLKLSGEMMTDDTHSFGIQPTACKQLAASIKVLRDTGVEIGIVIGGGNIFRGRNLESIGIKRSPADLMGMMATLINGVALQETLEAIGCHTKLLTGLECPKVAELYTWRGVVEAFASGSVVLFVGGTGNSHFTTDTAAALRAAETGADVMFKATKVDGVYSKDPLKFADAKRYETLSYAQVLDQNLGVIDATAVALCRDHRIPIIVFNMRKLTSGNAPDLLVDHGGTVISGV